VITLGIDPGTRHLGWGVVVRKGNRLEHVAHGIIHTDTERSLGHRLIEIECELVKVIERFKPTVGSVETLFFHRDPQAAAKLGHARGVVLLALVRAGLEVFEYAPARVKRTLTGRGQAEKAQVAAMVKAVLRLAEEPPADAADALALAVTHHRLGSLLGAIRRQSQPPQGEVAERVLKRGAAVAVLLGPKRGRRPERKPTAGSPLAVFLEAERRVRRLGRKARG
jgi:crossover junction endodeoxyribonuclease RuvC